MHFASEALRVHFLIVSEVAGIL